MPISAQRFTFLDNETNVGVSDFFSGTNTDILNSPINELKIISTDVETFLTNQLQSVQENLPDLTRASTDLLGQLNDVTGLDAKALLEQVKTLLPDNPLSQSLFSQLSATCKGRALGRRGSGRPYPSSNSCNGSRRPSSKQCGGSSQVFGNAIKQQTGGAFDFQFEDLNSQFNNLTSLSTMGYDMNMCNVFGSLSQGLPNDLVSKASGQLVSTLSSTKNIVGFFDLASSSAGLKTKLFNPATITSMLSSFMFPTEIRERDSSSLHDRYTSSMELFDQNWKTSDYDQMLSTQGIRNQAMSELMRRKNLDHIYDESQLNIAPNDDSVFLTLSY